MSCTKRKRESEEDTETRKRDWPDLPEDLLYSISNRLDTRVELPRIRGVCRSWRSSIPSSPPKNSSFRVDHILKPLHPDFTLEESTLYRFKNGDRGGEFVVRVQDSQPGKFFILKPSYYHREDYGVEKIPSGLNLFDCCVSQFQKTYKIKFSDGGFTKAAYSKEYSTLLFIDGLSLAYIRAGEDELTQVGDESDYSGGDIAHYKGNFYATDECGKIIEIDPVTMCISRRMNVPINPGSNKYFVQSQDDLYVVERQKAGHFKFYRLNELDYSLIRVTRMRDQVVFISVDCNLIASLSGFLGNSIYYTDDSDNVFCNDSHRCKYGGTHSGMCTLEDSFLWSLEDCRGDDKSQFYKYSNWFNG